MKKELVDSREELQKATEKLRKLKDLADEEINSLIAERDDSNEEKLAYERSKSNFQTLKMNTGN